MGTIKYITKRLLTLIPVLIGVTFFSFYLGHIAPGDPAEQALHSIGIEVPTKQQLEEQREEMGLNDPIFIQYKDWLIGVCQGDLGESYFNDTPILEEFSRRLPITLKLSLYALVTTIVLGVGSGILMALYQNRWIDNTLRSITMFFLSVPSFVLAVVMIIIFSEKLGILPTSGNGGIEHYIMPSLVLSAGSTAMTARVTRSSIITQMGEQYIDVVVSKGVSQRMSTLKHGIINALLPVITIIGNHWAGILGGSAIIESIFALNGIGAYVLTAINGRDYAVVQGYVLYAGTIYVVVTILIDMIYLLVDPKLRLEGK